MSDTIIEDDYFLEPYRNALFIYNQKKDEARHKDGKVHVSDILGCPRQSVFNYVEQTKPDPRTIFYFTIGQAIHNWIQDLLIAAYPGRYTKEFDLEISKELIAHPDLIDLQHDRVIELKTTTHDIKTPEPTHIKQLKTYLAALGKTSGDIIYFMYTKNPYAKNNNPNPMQWFKRFTVDIDSTEASTLLEQTITIAQAVKIAREYKDPSISPHIAYNNDENYRCFYCPHKHACEQMRQQALELEKEKYLQQKADKPLSSFTADVYSY